MSHYEEGPAAGSRRGGRLVLVTLLLFLAAVAVWRWGRWPESSGLNPNAAARVVMPRGRLSDVEEGNISIYIQASPCLAQVTNLTEQAGNWLNLDVQEVPRGLGSGFIWDEDGHVVTNYHVVKGADAAQVTLADHTTFHARQIWAYPDEDIAVLWINAPRKQLHPIAIGSSRDLKVGQVTYALGYPFALDQTMTSGIISALGRTIVSTNGRPIEGIIQTNAAINPGNSGGPLLDSAGRLIGMNSAIMSPSGTFAGIGFAIPVDEINRIVPQLIQNGKVVRPGLGVQIAPDHIARQLDVERGALILKVNPDGAGARAGLQGTGRDAAGRIRLGDVIMAINGKSVEDSEDFYSALEQYKVEDTVKLTVIRNDQQVEINVKLDGGKS